MRLASLLTLLLTLGAGLVCATPPIPPAPAQEPESPTIVVETNEVALDVVVRDKRGRVVPNLTPEDLNIIDAGHPVKIGHISRAQHDSSNPSLVIFYFDRLDDASSQNARDLVAKMLRAAPSKTIEYAVFGLAGRVRLFQGFTTEQEAIVRAVRALTNSPKKTDTPHLDVLAEQALTDTAHAKALAYTDGALAHAELSALREAQRTQTEQRASPLYGGLQAIVQSMREAPGRKTIVFFAEHEPTGPDVADTIRSLVGAANRAGVAIYVVDSNSLIDNKLLQGMAVSLGLSGQLATQQASATFNRGSQSNPLQNAPKPGQEAGKLMQHHFVTQGMANSQTELSALAQGTSGSFIGLTDNPKKAFQRLYEDMNAYYRVTYVPPDYQENGEFRQVVVTPVQKHLSVVARSGYYAVPPKAGDRAFETTLLRALAAQTLPRDLAFKQQVFHLGELPTGNQHTLVVETPLEQAEFQQDSTAHRYAAHVSMLAQIKTADGTVVQKFSDDVMRHGELAEVDQAKREVVSTSRSFELAPGTYTLETVVMDRNTGKAGVSRDKLFIPGSVSAPFLSDLMMVRRQLPYNPEVEPDAPLRYEETMILPDVSRAVPPGAQKLSFFLLVHPAGSSSAPPKFEMELRRNGEPLIRGPLKLTHAKDDAIFPYLVSIRANALPEGDYSMTAILTQDGQASERTVNFEIGDPKQSEIHTGMDAILGGSTPPPYIDRSLLSIERVDRIEPMSKEESDRLIASAKDRSLSYLGALPNFICIEKTARAVDGSGQRRWRHKDDYAELLRFHDQHEKRVMLEFNGHKTEFDRKDIKGTVSVGEFGGLFTAVFRPESEAKFEWKYSAQVGNTPVEVFAYSVDRKHSVFSIGDDSGVDAIAAYHGLVFIDPLTKDIRRISLESDDVPDKFVTQGTAITVDYDYVPISGHPFLMPVSAAVTVDKGKRGSLLNEIQFRDYRKYGAESSVNYE